MSGAYDCVIVGAGIVGAAAARSLAAAGRRILLLDQGTPGGEASAAAAGMLAAQIETQADHPLLSLALTARDRYPGLVADLERRTGMDLGFKSVGIVVVAFDPERAAELAAQAAAQRTLGLEAEWLDRTALTGRHPGIGPDALGAFLAPKDSLVNNVTLTAALLADAVGSGAEVGGHEAAVEVLRDGPRVAGVRTQRASYAARAVVLAAGAWSGAVRGLPRQLPVVPVRGQMALVAWPRGEPQGVLFGRNAYVVPRGESALLGSTMERAGFDKTTTAEGIRHVRTETGAVLPALLSLPILRSWAGLRPMTPDGLPIIGPDPDVQGLVYATGHGRNGILMGPLTGEIAAELVLRGETTWPIAPYGVTRFETGGGTF